jgi:protein tyrosine phosphatase
LNIKEGLEGSDYINANYISGEVPGSENTYISTQGPLPGTVGDFWRMVWEQNSKIVVMLTKEVEGGRAKCVKYWPDKDSRIYDDIRVSPESIDLSSKQVTTRHLILEHLKTNEKRKVVHYQYKEWPDHGLPSSTKAFLHLVHSAKRVDKDGPIVVHCSAGIGRSGTFCAVHALVQKMREELKTKGSLPPLNIVETVLNLRDQRPGMVQTKEQYMFCYLALQEEFQQLSQDKGSSAPAK